MEIVPREEGRPIHDGGRREGGGKVETQALRARGGCDTQAEGQEVEAFLIHPLQEAGGGVDGGAVGDVEDPEARGAGGGDGGREGRGAVDADGATVRGDEDLVLAGREALALEEVERGREPAVPGRGEDDEAEAGTCTHQSSWLRKPRAVTTKGRLFSAKQSTSSKASSTTTWKAWGAPVASW